MVQLIEPPSFPFIMSIRKCTCDSRFFSIIEKEAINRTHIVSGVIIAHLALINDLFDSVRRLNHRFRFGAFSS